MKKAIIYARVSTTEQAVNGTSLEQQQERGFEYAERRDAVVIRVCVDAGVSGTRYETRPGIIEAIEAIERQEATLLIVTKVDRLGRSARVIQQIAERIDRAGGQIITCDGMELGRSAIGRLTLNTFAGMAEFERDTIRERSMTGMKARAQQGIQPTRNRSPYGYHIVTNKDVDKGLYPKELLGRYTLAEETAQWAREIFTRYAGGMSLRGVARWLTAQGVPTARGGKQWEPNIIQIILQHPVYKGEPTFGRTETLHDESLITKQGRKNDITLRLRPEKDRVTLTAPALVDAQLWETCQERLRTNQSKLSGNPKRKFMLSSLIHCPACGRKMAGRNQKREPRVDGTQKVTTYYHCHPFQGSCLPTHYPAAKIENEVVASLAWAASHSELMTDALRAFRDTQAAQTGDNGAGERERLTAELARLEKELRITKEAMKAALRAGLKPEDFEADFADIAKRRAAVDARLAGLATPRLLPAPDPKSEAETLAAVSAAIVRALTAPEASFSAVEKQSLLAGIVESVTPGEHGPEVRMLWETVHNTSAFTMTGGTIGYGKTYDGTVNIFGSGSAMISMSGGTLIGDLGSIGGTVALSGGTVVGQLIANPTSVITFSGGAVQSGLGVYSGATLNLTGSGLTVLSSSYSAPYTVYSISGRLTHNSQTQAVNYSVFAQDGSNFEFNGHSVVSAASTPAPGSLAVSLLGCAGMGFGLMRRRQR